MGNSCSRSGTNEKYEISSISGFVVVRFMDGNSIKELQLTRECDRYVRKVHNMWWLTPLERKQIVSILLHRAEHHEKGQPPVSTLLETIAPGVLGSSHYEVEHYRKATFHIRDDDPYFGDSRVRSRRASRPIAQQLTLQNSSEYGGSQEDLTSNAPTPTNNATVHPNFVDVKVAWEINESSVVTFAAPRRKTRGKRVKFFLTSLCN